MASVLVAGETTRKKKPEKMLEMVSFKHHAGRGGSQESPQVQRERNVFTMGSDAYNVVR